MKTKERFKKIVKKLAEFWSFNHSIKGYILAACALLSIFISTFAERLFDWNLDWGGEYFDNGHEFALFVSWGLFIVIIWATLVKQLTNNW